MKANIIFTVNPKLVVRPDETNKVIPKDFISEIIPKVPKRVRERYKMKF